VDVAVVASADTDLIPAIDEVTAHTPVLVEVAGWHNGKWGQRLNAPAPKVWCHWLTADDYQAVGDATDYNL